MSEKQNQHQYIDPDIIPDSIKNVISEEGFRQSIQAVNDGKFILLNSKNEEQKYGFAKFIDNIIIRSPISPSRKLEEKAKGLLEDWKGATNTCSLSIIDRDGYKEKQFLKELERYTDIHSLMKMEENEKRKYFHFSTLFINNLRKTDCNTNRNDAFVTNVNRLRYNMKKRGRVYLKYLHLHKSKIKKAILGNYKKYPIFKQIKNEKNRAYQMKELSEKPLLDKRYKGQPSIKNELERKTKILKFGFGGFSCNELTKDEEEEMKECTNDILIDNKRKVEEIMSEVEPRGKDEIYKLIMEKPSDPSALIISFKDGKVPGEFGEEFQDEYVEIPPPLSESKKEVEQQEEEAVLTHEPLLDESKGNYVFCQDGERWYIKFEDEVLKPENLDGFKYIHYLMELNKPITPKKLYQAVKGIKKSNKDEEDSVETYTVNPKEIEKTQYGELKEHHSNDELKQFENELEKLDKSMIKKLADKLKKTKNDLINKKSEAEEEGHFTEAEDIEKDINDTQQKINIVTRLDHNPEYKQFYDLVSKAIKKAKEKIKRLSIENNYDDLLAWNHFEASINLEGYHYSYKPTTPINWEL